MGVTEITEGAVTQVPQSPGFSWKPVETQGFSLNSPYSPSSNQSIIHIIPYLSYLAKRRVFMVALPGPVSTCSFSLCFFQPSWDNQVDLAEALHIAACSVNLCGMTCHAPLIIRTYLSVFLIISVLQASDKVVPVLGKNRCALGKCVSQKSCL